MIDTQRLRQNLHKLIDIYSPSGKEEEIVEYLHGYLECRGLPVLRQPVDDKRHNLLLVPPDADVQLALVGHLDTVAAYDLDEYEYREGEGLITGLGASDMKGGCAAMIEAFVCHYEQASSGISTALALVVGEEEDGDGAERLAEGFHFPWVIIGEPTSLYPCLSQYSYLEINLGVAGKRMHASLANKAQNPIEAMLHLIQRISDYLINKRPESVYNIRDFFSSQASFSVPDRCNAWIDVHLPPEAPMGEIIIELEDIIVQEQQSHRELNVSLKFDTVDAGYALPEKGAVIESLKGVYEKHFLPWTPQPFRSHSDANHLWAAGMKPILLGCGNLDKAHAPDESVPFDQVSLAAEIYLGLLIANSA